MTYSGIVTVDMDSCPLNLFIFNMRDYNPVCLNCWKSEFLFHVANLNPDNTEKRSELRVIESEGIFLSGVADRDQ